MFVIDHRSVDCFFCFFPSCDPSAVDELHDFILPSEYCFNDTACFCESKISDCSEEGAQSRQHTVTECERYIMHANINIHKCHGCRIFHIPCNSVPAPSRMSSVGPSSLSLQAACNGWVCHLCCYACSLENCYFSLVQRRSVDWTTCSVITACASGFLPHTVSLIVLDVRLYYY